MIGTTLGHYTITARLGAGGMGEVFRATDTRLGREVALKVLPPEMAGDAARLERFTREARAIAALNHPHIVTIYSTEDVGGVRFLTIELVEGEGLERRIPQSGMNVEELFAVAVPLADALSAAHEKGIAHRDLKPSNVMVDVNGRVKVLDFGLAKVVDDKPTLADETQLALTREGLIVGTMPYMSPEQVAGRSVDARTDIFSFGIMLYEMATGRRPFAGESSAELMSAILRDAAPSVSGVRADLPAGLDRVVRRCLEKDPRDRFQTARDVFNELRDLLREVQSGSARVPATAAASRPASSHWLDSGATRARGFWVTVSAFRVATGDAEAAALADGLTEDVVTGLSRFSYLHVVRPSPGRPDLSSSGTRVESEAGLGARYVLEGSVRKAGASVRVTVQLRDATTGAHLWAESYDRDLATANLFQLQDELTGRIVSTSADTYGVLPRAIAAGVRTKGPAELTPYEAVLRALAYYQVISPAEHAEARAALERAVEVSPEYPDAWALLASVFLDELKQGFNVRPDPIRRARAAVRRAIELDAASHLGHYVLAQVHFFSRDFGAFRSTAERAVALNPLDGSTVAFMGILLAYAGEWDRGIAMADRAMALNPHHPGWYRFARFYHEYRQGHYERALEIVERVNMPSYPYAHAALAAVNGQLGRVEAARRAVEDLLALVPDFAERAREGFRVWFPDDFAEQVIDGLRKAGLDVPPPAV